MPLQNRVTPFAEIVAIPQRGLFTGNRGIIHDPATRTLLRRRWTTTAWLVCTCDYPGRRRAPMAARSWTELFFLDEAVALAAGHRPCFRCRREAAERFRACWSAAAGVRDLSVREIDAVLHRERLEGGRRRVHPAGAPDAYPDGTMVAAAGAAFLVCAGHAWRWTEGGYAADERLRRADELLTPPSTVEALRAGYRPVLHPAIAANGCLR